MQCSEHTTSLSFNSDLWNTCQSEKEEKKKVCLYQATVRCYQLPELNDQHVIAGFTYLSTWPFLELSRIFQDFLLVTEGYRFLE